MNLGRVIRMGKYVPVMNFVFMIGHVACLLLGFSLPLAEMVEVSLGFLLVVQYSRAVGFCKMHRLMIIYAYCVTVCIWYQRYVGFAYLFYARLLMLAVGVVLTIMFAFGYGRKRRVPGSVGESPKNGRGESV